MDRRHFLKAAGLIAGAMYVDLPTFAQKVSEMGEAKLRIGILSDIHLNEDNPGKTFRHALEYFRDKQADGVIIAGDMADWGMEWQIKLVSDIWYSVFPKDKLPNGKHVEKLFVYGNHDMEGQTYEYEQLKKLSKAELLKAEIVNKKEMVWKKYFHEDYKPVYLKTVKGYHFIGSQWYSWEATDGAPAFIEKNRKLLEGDKPFFYFQHAHPKGTCYGKWAWGQDNGEVTKELSTFPNAIAFSGHSHMPIDDEYDLWQGAFTSIGTSSLSYVCPLGARENSEVDGGKKMPAQMPVAGSKNKRQGMFMTVYDKNITIERREFMYDEAVAGNWIIPWPMKDQMSWERRKETDPIPQFAAGDKVSIREIKDGKDRYGVKQEQVEVSFPTVLKKRTGVRANDYEIEVEQEYVDTKGIMLTKRVFSPGAHLGENKDEAPVVCLFGKKELPEFHRYRFIVRPCNSFSRKGKAIYSEWQGEYIQ